MFYQTDKPRENHARIVRALELCSDIYRDIILNQMAPEDLRSRAEGRTRFYEGLSRDEKEGIKIASKKKTLENLDLSIMYKILRHVCIIPAPKSGWGTYTLLNPDVELADDIERIRFIRNETAGHSPRSQIEDATFNIFWNELSLVAERMDRRNFKHYTGSLEEILHCSMNAQVEAIKSITKDEQCLFNNKFHCRIDRIADEVQRRLWENNCIILTGIGGCGKTSFAKQAVKELSSKISTKDIYFVNTVVEFSSVVGLGDSQVVLIDDPFGKSNLAKTDFDSWQKHFSKMEALVKSKKLFLLMTCRKSIFESVRGSTDRYEIFNKNNTMDLSTEWNFTIAEKKCFLYGSIRYLNIEICDSHANLEKRKINACLIDSISKTTPRIGFQQACHLFLSNWDFFKQGLDFFVKADERLVKEINSVRARSPTDYAVLVYVLLQSNHEIDIERYEMELIEKICRLLGIMELSAVKIHDKVEFELSSLYLQKKRSELPIYTFQHESILESVLLSFCQFFAQDLLELAPFDTIRHFIRPSFHTKQKGEVCYILPPRLDNYLVCLYGNNIIEEKTPIDDLWIVCDFSKEHLQFLLNSLNERGIDYIYEKTKNIRKRFRMCNDAIRKYLMSEKASTLIKVVFTMFPNVVFEYVSLKNFMSENPQRKVVSGTIIDCTFSSVMLLYKDLSNEYCLTALVKLVWTMLKIDSKDVKFNAIKGMDNLIAGIMRLSCQKAKILFYSVVIKNFSGENVNQIFMSETFFEKAFHVLSPEIFDALIHLGDKTLLKCIEVALKRELTVVDNHISEFIKGISDMMFMELTEKLISEGLLCVLDHALKLVTEDIPYKTYSVSWRNRFIKESPFAFLSKLCKRLPNFVTLRTIKSAVNSGDVELLRLLFFFENTTEIHLQAISEWPNNDGKDISWNTLLEKDDCVVMFMFIKSNPEIITRETVQAAIETRAINSLKVILFYSNDSLDAVLQTVRESNIFLKIDFKIDIWRKILEEDDIDMSMLLKMIDRKETRHANRVKQIISRACQGVSLLCWKNSFKGDNAEIMSLIVKTMPQIITNETVIAAIETGAVNSLKVILSINMETVNSQIVMEALHDSTDFTLGFRRLLQKDDAEVMSLIITKLPKIITYKIVHAAIESGAVNSLKVILNAGNFKETVNSQIVMEALHNSKENTFASWKRLLEKDDAEIMVLLVNKIPQTVTDKTVHAAVINGAVNSLKVILTKEKEMVNGHIIMKSLQDTLEGIWRFPFCNRLLEKDDLELMRLLVTKIPQIISFRTVKDAIESGAVNSLKEILTFNGFVPMRIIPGAGEDLYKIHWSRLLKKDDAEIMSLLVEVIPQIITNRTVQEAIETGAVNSLKRIANYRKEQSTDT